MTIPTPTKMAHENERVNESEGCAMDVQSVRKDEKEEVEAEKLWFCVCFLPLAWKKTKVQKKQRRQQQACVCVALPRCGWESFSSSWLSEIEWEEEDQQAKEKLPERLELNPHEVEVPLHSRFHRSRQLDAGQQPQRLGGLERSPLEPVIQPPCGF